MGIRIPAIQRRRRREVIRHRGGGLERRLLRRLGLAHVVVDRLGADFRLAARFEIVRVAGAFLRARRQCGRWRGQGLCEIGRPRRWLGEFFGWDRRRTGHRNRFGSGRRPRGGRHEPGRRTGRALWLAVPARLLGQDGLVRQLTLGRQLVEAQPHARHAVGPSRVVLAHPRHGAEAGKQRGSVAEREVELQGGSHLDGLPGADENTARTDINAISTDEFFKRRALEPDA